MRPRTGWDCQSTAPRMSWSVVPSGRFSILMTLAFLPPWRAVAAALFALATLAALTILSRVGACAVPGTPLAPLSFFCATWAACGAGEGARGWMAFQIRLTAALRWVNLLTGLRPSKDATPAKAFQTSAKRIMGHPEESLARSFSVAKRSKPASGCTAVVAGGDVVVA